MIVHACCCHGLFNECYGHIRNVVHVNFDTDHPHRCEDVLYIVFVRPPSPPHPNPLFGAGCGFKTKGLSELTEVPTLITDFLAFRAPIIERCPGLPSKA